MNQKIDYSTKEFNLNCNFVKCLIIVKDENSNINKNIEIIIKNSTGKNV